MRPFASAVAALVFGAVLTGAAAAQPSEPRQAPAFPITLDDAIRQALERNRELVVVRREVDVVQRITGDFHSVESIAVGDGPTAVAFGADAVWVANTVDGTVSRIDPETFEVKTIAVGNPPAGIAVSDDGRVWVSVQAPPTP